MFSLHSTYSLSLPLSWYNFTAQAIKNIHAVSIEYNSTTRCESKHARYKRFYFLDFNFVYLPKSPRDISAGYFKALSFIFSL